jgi:uncharacterized protein YndB with AHSA1/START domain
MTTHPTTVTAEPGTPFLEVVREFDAPADAVFRAWTDPELVTQWLSPDDLTMTIDEWQPRSGGRYRYVHAGRDGAEFAFRGTFHTIRPDLLVQTFEFEGAPDVVSLDTLRLSDVGGRTRVEIHSVFPSVAARDAMVAAGMENGLTQGFAKLDRLVG